MNQLSTEYEKMFENAVNALAKYIDDNGVQSLVLGVSGGVDSALVAALASHAVNRTMNKIPIIGRSITIETNSPDEIARAKAVGEIFCTDFEELDLTVAYNNFVSEFEAKAFALGDTEHKIAMGNVKARLRMIQLYHLAGISGGMVLSTDNFTELMVGFWTLHGDVGDYGMIQNLWKTEVYGLTDWLATLYSNHNCVNEALALDACSFAVPTDGLGITSSDLEQLGADTYQEVDQILMGYFNYRDNLEHPVVKRHLATQFKRENPYNIPRKELV